MHFKKFLLSFAATSLLITPLAINAKGPTADPLEELLLAPAAGEKAVVEGLSFHAEYLTHNDKTATMRVTAVNETKKLIDTKVTASLMQPPAVSPMARMVPMPREVAQNLLTLKLAPGETYSATITVKLPDDISNALVAAEQAPPSQADSLELGTPAPSFFASIRAAETTQEKRVAPPVLTQAQRVATK